MTIRFKALTAVVMGCTLLAGCAQNNAAPASSPTAVSTAGSSSSSAAAAPANGKKTELTFFYPVAVSGPLAKVMEGYVNEFNQSHPNIQVQAVYSGDYVQTMTKVMAAVKGGGMPDVAVMAATDVLGLKDAEAILPLDSFAKKDSDGDGFMKDFFPAFMPKYDDKYWGIPFQRSTPVLYYNKEMFKEAGLDPNKPPANWKELEDDAKKLTKRDTSGQVNHWGVMIGVDDTWIIQGYIMQQFSEPKRIFNDAGTKVDFNTEATKTVLSNFIRFAKEDKVMPETLIQTPTLTSDFVAGKTAMMFYSTGGLGFVRDNAKFEFGTAFLPAAKQFAAPTGGGNLYLLNTKDEAKENASWEFIRWMTTPERAAKWSIDSGYVAPRKAAYDVPSYQDYTKKYPQALIARDQLQYAQTELTTHNNGEVTKAMTDTLQGIYLGKVSVDQGLADAQAKIDKALQPYAK